MKWTSANGAARALLLMLMLTLSLQQAQAFDVHGVRLGDRWDAASLEQAMSYVSVPGSKRFKCPDDGKESCTGTTRYLVADVRLTVEGRDGRVSSITMTLPTEDFEEEIAALKREFGEPTAEWTPSADVTTPLLFRHRVDWRLPKEELFALKFSAMATISLTTPQDSLATRYPPPG
jgi:hypothetical protein